MGLVNRGWRSRVSFVNFSKTIFRFFVISSRRVEMKKGMRFVGLFIVSSEE